MNDNTNIIVCPKCTFHNHPAMKYCEICLSMLNDAKITNQNRCIQTMENSILFESEQFESFSLTNCHTQTISDCISLQRISLIIKHHATIKKYSNEHILNDFHHLLLIHSNQIDFHQIYKYLINAIGENYMCQITKCNALTRIYRDRSKLNINNISNNATSELIDKIHCYLLHSYDIGFRLNLNEQQHIELLHNKKASQYKAISEYINKRKTILRKNNMFERIHSTDNKFIIKTSKINKVENELFYSFGYRFWYWNATHIWYIASKFNSLKSELLQNEIYNIDLTVWTAEMDKAVQYTNSDYVKGITANWEWERFYGIKPTSVITLNHILAVLMYCNMDILQKKFTETYRKMPANESNELLKQRHSNWANLGKLLRETVECFGHEIRENKHNLSFYHGVSEEFMFMETISKFKGPTSTSSAFMVALNFTNNNGLVIELGGDQLQNGKYFSFGPFSDFAYEQEMFFLGGQFPLQIQNVYHVILSETYQIYLQAMNIINSLMNGKQYITRSNSNPLSQNIQLLVKCLLKHVLNGYNNKNIPNYIQRLLKYYFSNVKKVTIYWDYMIQENEATAFKGYKFLYSIFCLENIPWINMNVLLRLFEHLQSIEIQWIKVNSIIVEYIYSFLLHLKSSKLHQNLYEIIIYKPNQKNGGMIIHDIIQKYLNDFQNIGWTMFQTEDHLLRLDDNYDNVQLLIIQKINNKNIQKSYLQNVRKMSYKEIQSLSQESKFNQKKNTEQISICREESLIHWLTKQSNAEAINYNINIVQLIIKYFEYYPATADVIEWSSEYGNGNYHRARNVSIPYYKWTSNGHGPKFAKHQWLIFDFDKMVRFHGIQIYCDSNDSCPNMFRIEICNEYQSQNQTPNHEIFRDDYFTGAGTIKNENALNEALDKLKWENILVDHVYYNQNEPAKYQIVTDLSGKINKFKAFGHHFDEWDVKCHTFFFDKAEQIQGKYCKLYIYENCGSMFTSINFVRFLIKSV